MRQGLVLFALVVGCKREEAVTPPPASPAMPVAASAAPPVETAPAVPTRAARPEPVDRGNVLRATGKDGCIVELELSLEPDDSNAALRASCDFVTGVPANVFGSLLDDAARLRPGRQPMKTLVLGGIGTSGDLEISTGTLERRLAVLGAKSKDWNRRTGAPVKPAAPGEEIPSLNAFVTSLARARDIFPELAKALEERGWCPRAYPLQLSFTKRVSELDAATAKELAAVGARPEDTVPLFGTLAWDVVAKPSGGACPVR